MSEARQSLQLFTDEDTSGSSPIFTVAGCAPGTSVAVQIAWTTEAADITSVLVECSLGLGFTPVMTFGPTPSDTVRGTGEIGTVPAYTCAKYRLTLDVTGATTPVVNAIVTLSGPGQLLIEE